MTHRSALASLFALVTLALAACVGPFASDDATPPGVADTSEGFATICGIALVTPATQEREQGARDCLLEGHDREEHRELFDVELKSTGIDGSLIVTHDGNITIHAVSQLQRGTPNQYTLTCASFSAGDDATGFKLEECTPSQPRTGTLTPDPVTAICGLEVVDLNNQHFAADARRCLRDAFEAGTPARFYSSASPSRAIPSPRSTASPAPANLSY